MAALHSLQASTIESLEPTGAQVPGFLVAAVRLATVHTNVRAAVTNDRPKAKAD